MEVEMSLEVHNWNARMLKLVLILNECTQMAKGTSYLFQWSASLHFTNINFNTEFLSTYKTI